MSIPKTLPKFIQMWPRWEQLLLADLLLFAAFGCSLRAAVLKPEPIFLVWLGACVILGIPALWLAYIIPLQKRGRSRAAFFDF
jgi:hypothetical protein